MKKKRLSVEQITSVLQQVSRGVPVGDVCRQVGVSEQTFYRWKPDDQSARREEVGAFLRDINQAFPALALKEDEITLVHRGVVPAAARAGRLTLSGQSRIIDHAKDGGIPGLISIVGVKYTTARAVAEGAVDLVFRNRRSRGGRCRRPHADGRGWSEERKRREIEALKAFFDVL